MFCTLCCAQQGFSQKRTLVVDTLIKTTHSTTIKDKKSIILPIPERSLYGMKKAKRPQVCFSPITNDQWSFTRKRPLIFIQRRAGSASVWMHMAYTGPKILKSTMRLSRATYDSKAIPTPS